MVALVEFIIFVEPIEFVVEPIEFVVEPIEFVVEPIEFVVEPIEFVVEPVEFVVLVVEPLTSVKVPSFAFEVLTMFVIEIIMILSPIATATALTSVIESIRFLVPISVLLIMFSPFSIVVKKTLDMTMTTLTKVLMMMLEVSLTKQKQGEQCERNKEERVSEHSIVVCW